MSDSNPIFTTDFLQAYMNWIIKIFKNTGMLFAFLILNSLMIALVYRSKDKDAWFGYDIRKAPYYYVGTYDRDLHGKKEQLARNDIKYLYDLDDSLVGVNIFEPEFYNIRKYTWPYNNINYDNYISYYVGIILFTFWGYRYMLRKILHMLYPNNPNATGTFTYKNFMNKLLLLFGPTFLILATMLCIAPTSIIFGTYASFAEQWPRMANYMDSNPFYLLPFVGGYIWLFILYIWQVTVGIMGNISSILCWFTLIPLSLAGWYLTPILQGWTNFWNKIKPILLYNKQFILALIVLSVYMSAVSTLGDYPNVTMGIGIVVIITLLLMFGHLIIGFFN